MVKSCLASGVKQGLVKDRWPAEGAFCLPAPQQQWPGINKLNKNKKTKIDEKLQPSPKHLV